MIEKVALAVIVAFLGLIIWYIQRAIVTSDTLSREAIKSTLLLEQISDIVRAQGVTNAKNTEKIDEMGKQLTRVVTKQDSMEKVVDGIVKKLNR